MIKESFLEKEIRVTIINLADDNELSQRQIAIKSGVNQSNISKYLRGKVSLSLRALGKIYDVVAIWTNLEKKEHSTKFIIKNKSITGEQIYSDEQKIEILNQKRPKKNTNKKRPQDCNPKSV